MAHRDKALTREKYEEVVRCFRNTPGRFIPTARAANIDKRTAKRLWFGPPPNYAPWATPIRDRLQAEEEEARQAKAAEAARVKAAIDTSTERQAKQAKEAREVDDNIMRAARGAALAAITAHVRLSKAMDLLATRAADQLSRGVDAKGNPIELDVKESLGILRRYDLNARDVVSVAKTVIILGRLREDKPTAILGVDMQGDLTLDEIQREVELAQEAVERAKELGLTVLEGGKTGAA
jgi:hypothetical protein